jgi:hypothetical protein
VLGGAWCTDFKHVLWKSDLPCYFCIPGPLKQTFLWFPIWGLSPQSAVEGGSEKVARTRGGVCLMCRGDSPGFKRIWSRERRSPFNMAVIYCHHHQHHDTCMYMLVEMLIVRGCYLATISRWARPDPSLLKDRSELLTDYCNSKVRRPLQTWSVEAWSTQE